MKNHFFISYFGNKRQEVEGLYNQIKDKLDNIDTIVEPFCGTSAFSYYLSLKHPKRFKYILNDNNHHLLSLYQAGSDPEQLDALINKLTDFSKDITKEKYDNICKADIFENWMYKHKCFSIRPGMFPIRDKIKTDFSGLKDTPIIKFLRNEDVSLYNEEGVSIVELFKDNNKALIFLDPPYLMSCNSFYYDSKLNIYEYLHNNPIEKMKAYIVLCLEDNWIIKLLFNQFIKSSHNKRYEVSGKKTSHLIITN